VGNDLAPFVFRGPIHQYCAYFVLLQFHKLDKQTLSWLQ
jgi:hypothetical protein